jgi:Spherulation-specific family 4
MRSRLLVPGLMLLLVGTSMVVSQQPSVAQRSRYLQVAIPGYIFSDDLRSWELITNRSAFIPIVVVNPRNGPNVYAGTRCDGFTPPNDPGTGPNLSGLRSDDDFVPAYFPNDPKLVTSQTNYLSTLEQHFARRSATMASSGIGVYGYVWSNTNGADAGCRRTVGIVADEIDLYKRAYGISNVFFDDASGACPNDTLRSMTDVARNKGAKVIVNVGSPAGACVATQADVVVNSEGTPASYFGARDALIANAALLRAANPNVKIWHIVYGVADVEISSLINQAATSADYLYITDDTTQAHGCDRGNSNYDALYGMWPIIRQDVPGCTSRFNGNPTSFAQVVVAINKGELPAASGTASTLAPTATSPAAPSTTAPLTFAPIVAPTSSSVAPVILAAPIVSSLTTTTTALVTTSTSTPVTTLATPNSTTSTVTPKPAATSVSTTTTNKPSASKVTTVRLVVQKKTATKKTAIKKTAPRKIVAKKPTLKKIVKPPPKVTPKKGTPKRR